MRYFFNYVRAKIKKVRRGRIFDGFYLEILMP